MNRWQPQPASDLPDGLILFDGVCVLCSGMVTFVIPRDKARHFRFVPVQSEAGAVLARRFGVAADGPETIVVVDGGRALFKADASVAIGRALPGWRWTGLILALPRPVRDFFYDRVARNRYRLFGRRDACLRPSPEQRSRFIDSLSDLPGAA